MVGLVGAATIAMLTVSGPAMGKGPGGGGKPPTGEESAKNLSVPALFVGAPNPYGLDCAGEAILPTGTPSTGYPVPGYYYVQGKNTWQAECRDNLAAATVVAAWGDNLTGSAKKSVGSPIRVEVGLTTEASELALTGWDVIKLDDGLADRVAPYGTLALADGVGGFASVPKSPYPETRVWTAQAMLSITNTGTGAVVYAGPAGAEINSTGRVVFGYNLRVPTPGTYAIEYTFPRVSITSAAPGTVSGQTVRLEITVPSGGGGGGGRPAR
jgi:hypothetical protein